MQSNSPAIPGNQKIGNASLIGSLRVEENDKLHARNPAILFV